MFSEAQGRPSQHMKTRFPIVLNIAMKDISVEIGMLMCWGSEKLVLRSESANNVLPAMASAIALTNSREVLNQVKCRATTSRDILYWLRGTISLDQHAQFSFLSVCVRVA